MRDSGDSAMKCLICGKDFVALGVHVKLKHKVEAADYRLEFGLMKTAPLVDPLLSKLMSSIAKDRFLDQDYAAVVAERMNTPAWRDRSLIDHKAKMSQAGKDMLSERNRKRAEKYRDSIADKVKDVLDKEGTCLAVRKKLGCGREVIRKLEEAGKVKYDLERAIRIRQAKAGGKLAE